MPFGISSQRINPLTGIVSQYDAYKELQGQLAKEQWNFQKQLYQQQLASAQQGARGLSSLISSYNTAFNEAQAANEARYNQMLGIADQTTGQRLADIRSDYAMQRSSGLQSLARLGMSNTTAANAVKYGTEREMQASLNRAADELQGTKLGIMERRTDTYPDQNLIVSLASMLGSSGLNVGGILQSLGNIRMG